MPRTARQVSETGIYHVIVRGINRENLFLDSQDIQSYLQLIARYKKECGVTIYAYCLMPNHVHLLVQENAVPLNIFMRKVGTSYSYRLNTKYNRTGHVFQDRY